MSLDIETYFKYYKAMDQLEASESIERLTIADWPRIKDKTRDKILSSLRSRANPADVDSKKKGLSNSDVAKLIMG